jgi:AcrR family transcriptional regulator
MIEAVAANGYEKTSVKQVIGLAGVSRRSFYEQFANKRDCFLATFDMLSRGGLRRAGDACLASDGQTEDRLRAVFGELARAIAVQPKAAGLVIVEAQRTGPAGVMRLCQAIAGCEQMLRWSFEPSPLPAPVIRGIAGGLHAAADAGLRDASARAASAPAEEMVRWTMLFQTSAAGDMGERLGARAIREAFAAGRVADRASERAEGARERIMQEILRLAGAGGLRGLTAPQIAAQAGVSIDAFFELFADLDECFMAALEMLGNELLRAAGEPFAACADWPRAVRRSIGALMRLLGGREHYAQTIACGAFAAGPVAVERNLANADALARLLLEGAPAEPAGVLAVHGVAGAISHTVRCQVVSGRIRLLPALSDYLSYVVLAPFIGAEAAVEVVSEDVGQPRPLRPTASRRIRAPRVSAGWRGAPVQPA